MKLDEYRKKRDAERTNEPLGDEPEARKPTWRGAFVVHQHDATRMHFDLRLEVGGALASFAIPKGPTLDPEVKHLAVHTEDHPIEYLDFEAVIPDGNYGAGPMICWDFGVVRYLDESAEEGIRSGKLHFQLEGRKLRGRFALVRVKGRSDKKEPDGASREWLFFKKQDAAASKRDIVSERPESVLSGLTVAMLAEMPKLAARIEAAAFEVGAKRGGLDGRKLSPMLCTLGDVPTGPGFLHELKLDGVRIIATKDAAGVDLVYRSGRSANASYPEVIRAIQALASARVVLDGEIVAFDDAGKPNFERLATRIHASPRSDLRRALVDVPVVFVVFDLLAVGDAVLVDLPLVVRKELLARLIPAAGVLRALDHLDRGGDKLFAFCRENGLEGVVSKRADGVYRPGPTRSGEWIKTKCEREDVFVVVGYTVGERSRGRLGALDLATTEGDDFVIRGRVGSGLNDARIDELLAKLGPLVTDGPTAKGEYESAPRGRTHVKPAVVVRVRFLEWSEDGALRFPVYLGLESDVDPRSCTAAPHDESHVAPPTGSDARAEQAAPEAISVKVTNRAKVFWPEEGYTKGDLVDYYAAIAPTLLPYLEDRPVMLVRYPDGIDGKSFYQWNVPHGMPPWVRSVVLGKHLDSPEEGDHKKHVFVIDRRESLVYVANLACIPIHVLASRLSTPRACDFLTIDFDVNLSSLRVAIDLAHTLRAILDEVGLVGYPKTSGQTGLHVHVPMGPGVSPTAARTLADLLGRLVVDRHPKDATMERVVQKRGAKVYVDTGQTGPSRTIVAPYSVRATRGARVATPLRWDEVVPDLDPGRFTIRTVPERVSERGDPMKGLLTGGPDMGAVMQKLAARLATKG
ncbi:MAG TPA: DNA ligase D [Polyangiaceae bacterium]|nr:DNA ligase D [Polyangiaceae bacterium]